MDELKKEKIINFLKEDRIKLGVISTVAEDGEPSSAFVYYAYDNDLNIYFITRTGSKKYKNIVLNPNAAFAIATEQPPKTVQLKGTATVVEDPKAQTELFPKLVTLAIERNFIPPISKMDTSEIMFMKISPSWIRIGDFSSDKKGGLFEEIELKK